MDETLVSTLRALADEAEREAALALEARDADYCRGEAAAYREAARLIARLSDDAS